MDGIGLSLTEADGSGVVEPRTPGARDLRWHLPCLPHAILAVRDDAGGRWGVAATS
jgi:hypothetical protein